MADPHTVSAHRVAAYFAPSRESGWWDGGSHWLGRCAERCADLAQPPIDGVSAELFRHLTAAPRRYGWHATLKAPFALVRGVDAPRLRERFDVLRAAHSAFELPALRVTRLDDFLALVPDAPCAALDAVAGDAVARLHDLARPLDAAELARRRSAVLTPVQDALLLRWGYPFVFDQFRFHLSLTGSLAGVPPAVVDAVEAAARRHFGVLPACRFDAVALFVEPRPGSDFMLAERFALRVHT